VFKHFSDCKSVINVTVEHRADKVDAVFREGKEGDSEGVVEDLVNIVEWVLLIDNGIEEDTQGPDVLFLATIRAAL
jgi:hypothetical protein